MRMFSWVLMWKRGRVLAMSTAGSSRVRGRRNRKKEEKAEENIYYRVG